MTRQLLMAFMAISGTAYAGSAVCWYLVGKPWMAVTFALYATTILTLYLAGEL